MQFFVVRPVAYGVDLVTFGDEEEIRLPELVQPFFKFTVITPLAVYVNYATLDVPNQCVLDVIMLVDYQTSVLVYKNVREQVCRILKKPIIRVTCSGERSRSNSAPV